MSNKVFAQQFGMVIRQLRLESGLSQEEFAHRCNLHRTYIGSVERGEKNVTLQTALKFAQALQVTLSHLILLAENQHQTND